MMWDFAATNPFGGSVGSFESMVKSVLNGLKAGNCSVMNGGKSEISSAEEHPLPDDTAQFFFSDPPYYDAVPYADLSDFFYVWFKRTLGNRMPDLFSERLTDKIRQAVVNHPDRGDERADFESKMMNSMREGCRLLAPDGIGCIVFAHKSTAGWEAQLQAMVDAGWTMTASWPIDTEMGSRMNAMGTAALASSVHLVVRPRITRGHNVIGDWRDVLNELPKRIHAWLPHLAEEGVVGADAIFACIGPALEIFSRYDSVEKASGEVVTLREYLEHVWAAVSREALSTVVADADLSGFESDARLSAMWLWTVAASPDGDGKAEAEADATKLKPTGFSLEYDAARKIAQGLGANLDDLKSIVEVKGDKATLLPVAQRTEYLFGKGETEPTTARGRKKQSNQLDMFAELIEDGAHEEVWEEKTVSKPGETILDRVHQAMILFASGRGEALKRFLVDDGVGQDPGLWKLAQAFSALYPPGTQEKRWVDGVLARKKGLGL
jgi:adenine-specific DNA methylase